MKTWTFCFLLCVFPLPNLSHYVFGQHSFFRHLVSSSSDICFLLHSLPFITFLVSTMFVHFILSVWWGCVSPYWQREITAPGIESSSLASGWRSASQMKRMLVHLKVAAETDYGCTSVILSLMFNPGWFGFHF